MKMSLDSTRTGHVGLNVTNLDRLKRFYRKLFGFDLQLESSNQGTRYAFLTCGGRLILSLWEQSEGRFKRYRPGLHHLAFQVSRLDYIVRAKKILDKLHVPYRYDETVGQPEGAIASAIFFEDPDGTRLEIYCLAVREKSSQPASGA